MPGVRTPHLFWRDMVQPITDVYLNVQEFSSIVAANNLCPKRGDFRKRFTRIIYFIMILFFSFIWSCNTEQLNLPLFLIFDQVLLGEPDVPLTFTTPNITY